LRLTLATVAADHGGELEAAIEVLCLIALKGKVVTADAARTAIAARLRRSTKGAPAIIVWRDPPIRTQRCLTPGPVSASCRQITLSRVRREPGIAARRPGPAW